MHTSHTLHHNCLQNHSEGRHTVGSYQRHSKTNLMPIKLSNESLSADAGQYESVQLPFDMSNGARPSLPLPSAMSLDLPLIPEVPAQPTATAPGGYSNGMYALSVPNSTAMPAIGDSYNDMQPNSAVGCLKVLDWFASCYCMMIKSNLEAPAFGAYAFHGPLPPMSKTNPLLQSAPFFHPNRAVLPSG